MKLEADRVGPHRAAGQARPPDRVLALSDPLLCCATPIVEGDHALGWAAQIGHQEPDTRIEFARVPLDLGHNPARVGPSLGLVAKAGVKASDLMSWTPHRAREQVNNPSLQNSIAGRRIT